MKIENFITLTDKERRKIDLRVGDNLVINKEGHLLYNMERTVPVIVKEVGCIGFARINSVTLLASGNTKIDLMLEGVSKRSAEAAYICYQNAIGGADGDDEEMIPGVYRSRTQDNERPKAPTKKDLPDFLK